jgi:hypothetical protein
MNPLGRSANYNSETNGDDWLQDANKDMEKNNTKGRFTQQAKRAGMSVQQFARHVLQNKAAYSTRTLRRAVFALNVAKFN